MTRPRLNWPELWSTAMSTMTKPRIRSMATRRFEIRGFAAVRSFPSLFAIVAVTRYSGFMSKASGRALVSAIVMAAACAPPKAPEPVAAPVASTLPAPASASGASVSPAPSSSAAASDAARLAADELHRAAIVVDTHNDVTQRLALEDADLSRPFPDAQTDIPRMQAGMIPHGVFLLGLQPVIVD